MIISSCFTVGDTKLINIPNTTITCNILHRCIHLLAQAHRISFPHVLLLFPAGLLKGNGAVCALRSSQS